MNSFSAMHPVAVVIGRWQLPHLAHLALLQKAYEVAEHVVVVIGSALRAPNPKNPFNTVEREAMLRCMLDEEQLARTTFLPIRDYANDKRWENYLQQYIHKQYPNQAIALVGYKKNESSYYLERFPSWRYINAGSAMEVDAAALRAVYFSDGDVFSVLQPYVHPAVIQYLKAWKALPQYRVRQLEHQAVESYKQRYTCAAYLTADTVLEVDKHILLIKRGGNIGNGQWALPGGFVDKHETFYHAALRELTEETQFKPLRATMDAALVGQAVFDAPDRSPRGRLVTTAFHFRLKQNRLPQVEGADDASEAVWWPISELPTIEAQLFEDHAIIIDHFISFM